MTDHATTAPSTANVTTKFWVIGILALLWNLIGLASFFMYVNMSEDALALMSEAQRAEFENTPMWLLIVYGIAVFTGTLGCVALLMRKKWAVLLFLISFIAVIIQFAFGVINSAAVQEQGAAAMIVPILVIVVAGLLWYYSRMCEAKGLLN